MMKPIPIIAAKVIAEQYGYSQVVVIARAVGDDGGEHVTTYGIDKSNCDVAAQIGRFIKHKLMGWPRGHPTGSDHFARELEGLGVPAPWRLCEDDVGVILAADGGDVCSADTRVTDRESSELALWIIMAVNTLAGFKAEVPK